MKVRSLFLGVVTLLLIGAGCGAANSGTQTGGTGTTDVKKKPTTVSLEEQAYDACVDAGYKIGVQTDESGASISYCVFGGGTACPLLLFGDGTCTATSGAGAFDGSVGEALQQVRSCDETSPSVCGVNKKTYVNACIAELQQVDIAHEGDCTPEEIASLVPSLPPQTVTANNKKPGKTSSSSGSTTSGKTPTGSSSDTEKTANTTQPLPPSEQLPNTPGTHAEWLSMLIDLTLAEPVHTPRAFIEYCAYGKNTVYYFEQGGTPTFSALYNTAGTVVCFPHNDVNKSCPTYFNKDSRSGSCTQAWKDGR